MKSLGVFCGSHAGRGESYRTAAAQFAREVARRGITIVYGGGNVGLMGVVADAALAAGGRVVGVLPRFMMEREVGHAGLSELHLVDSMHERKAKMAELSDAFVALPGGLGTLEELFEAWTWMQLGLQQKPCGLLTVGNFFDPLLAFLDRAVGAGVRELGPSRPAQGGERPRRAAVEAGERRAAAPRSAPQGGAAGREPTLKPPEASRRRRYTCGG